jgi:hypothetical protein
MNFSNFFKRKPAKEDVISFGHGLAFRRALSMPSKMPEGIEFHYNKNAGMQLGGTAIRISGNSSRYYTHYSSYSSGYSFTTTPEELENLYNIFRDNNFHKIEHDGKSIMDVPGDSLSLQWQDQCIEIRRGTHGQIKQEHRQAYYNCLGAMESLAEKDYTKYLKKVKIQMDETIRKEFNYSLFSEEALRIKLFENNGDKKSFFSSLLGVHNLMLEIEEPYSEKLNVMVPVLENHNTVLNLFMSNNKLNWETIISR